MTGPALSWWDKIHEIVNNVPWASFDAVMRMTPAQLLCLYQQHAPGTGKARSFEEYEAMAARARAEAEAWGMKR